VPSEGSGTPSERSLAPVERSLAPVDSPIDDGCVAVPASGLGTNPLLLILWISLLPLPFDGKLEPRLCERLRFIPTPLSPVRQILAFTRLRFHPVWINVIDANAVLMRSR
jgi:hypothetical protein